MFGLVQCPELVIICLANKELRDLFLLDVMLPDGNGIDLCHQIRRDSRSSVLPVLIMSSQRSEDAARTCEAESFIAKPFDLFNRWAKLNRI
ncbi:response regulator [Pedobacter sp. V48]|uniref:response regulator n=1 Tax=Pedobacter sp. V48 TaxID=509635 RepID=UPI0003E52E98|nr:hypothetical protein N824_01785 [Pedobacter sp. V48]